MAEELIHELWGTPPGRRRPILYAAYDEAEWQKALKYGRLLREGGVRDVHLRDSRWDRPDGGR